jgi:hypothetical protein
MTLFAIDGEFDGRITWRVGDLIEANGLLAREHYLGAVTAGGSQLVVVGDNTSRICAVQVWRQPTSRRLPADGSWLELSRWCLTHDAGEYAGSRQHKAAVRLIRRLFPAATTLVSYSDPAHGHTGALYRACNWQWSPTWLRLRPPPGGHGAWIPGQAQSIKDRWTFAIRRDAHRSDVLRIDDLAAIRFWRERATAAEIRWAAWHPQLRAGAA